MSNETKSMRISVRKSGSSLYHFTRLKTTKAHPGKAERKAAGYKAGRKAGPHGGSNIGLQASREAGGNSGGGERTPSPSSLFISRTGEADFGIILTLCETPAGTRATSTDVAPALNNPRVALGVNNTPRRPHASTAYSAPFKGAPLTPANRAPPATGRRPRGPIPYGVRKKNWSIHSE